MAKSPQKNSKPPAADSTAPPSYLSGLSKSSKTLTTSDGHKIEIWELAVSLDPISLSKWASHFRQHYCSDSEIDALRAGTGLSRADYLTQLVFPDEAVAPGPGIRAGDFAELLVSDYVEYLLKYWVPRGKYADKSSRDESIKGVDILGFRLNSPPGHSPEDTLLAFEVKAQLSGKKYSDRLQTAINDSSKDYLRRAITLNATKRRLIREGNINKASIVQRFQNPSDNPFVYRSGAAAVLSERTYDKVLIQKTTAVKDHNNVSNLELVVIHGKDLMTLIHSLYKKAADEA